jgi:hypothetical protein
MILGISKSYPFPRNKPFTIPSSWLLPGLVHMIDFTSVIWFFYVTKVRELNKYNQGLKSIDSEEIKKENYHEWTWPNQLNS